ncbi:MAG: pyruvate, phosphate dikinase [Syntrophobacteraceae bacterium]|nr:pyruvate, phosphate dikinase [Syntrophobacteraceae bacterium]
MVKKWVYSFDELDQAASYVGGDWDRVRGLLGGKGANLADMTRLGLPVPPGFTVTTEACKSYLEGMKFPEAMWEQELAALAEVEKKTGKKFGDANRPLLVSCRSGAKFSMPGMMDTVLNIGLNDQTVKGMIDATGDPRFVYDSYRRLIQMFGSVVMEAPDEPFEEVIVEFRKARGVKSDTDLRAEDWKAVGERFKVLFQEHSHVAFPSDPLEQLHLATEAVFKSWNGKRAIDYRNAAKIAHDLGTAVNIVTMVFGNMGQTSATGVATTRNVTNGEKKIEGDFLINAQGEDVVAGIRDTLRIERMADSLPDAWNQLLGIASKLEKHYGNVQDIEFTVEKGVLWMLQTRDAKRTAEAAVRIAVDMVEEGFIAREEAVASRVTTEQVDFFLHAQFSVSSKKAAKAEGKLLASGLNVSPGAAVGVVAFTADLAESWAKREGKKVIMVRPETKPDDVHGMLAAEGVVTSRGGRTSHAALVARQFGKPAVVGVAALDINVARRMMKVGDQVVKEGDWISIDGTTGEVFLGQLETKIPDISDPSLIKLLQWADEYSRLQVWTNADYPHDAKRAREFGARGIGLCRTEHMFFQTERLPYVQKLIMTKDRAERHEALDALLPYQREDFAGLFKEMDGLPVIIRLIDPPLHEFLPSAETLASQLADCKIKLQHARDLHEINELLSTIEGYQRVLKSVEALHEANPMLGLRGVRLGLKMPELTQMQVRAIFEAACECASKGIDVHPEIMIPLTGHVNELRKQRSALEAVAKDVMEEWEMKVNYKFGTMIEVPRAALTADEMAEYAEFFSFGTNDLTQMVFGISRDDAEKGFLIDYIRDGILPENPFESIDEHGVAKIMRMAVEAGRKTRPELEVGICGEHGGDPKSIGICHHLGLNYVSCSPFRVPIARLAAAQVALKERRQNLGAKASGKKASAVALV